MDNVSFSTEKLLLMLEIITLYIQDGHISKEEQQQLWELLNWNKHDPENKELVKYLFTGWWIHQNIPLIHS